MKKLFKKGEMQFWMILMIAALFLLFVWFFISGKVFGGFSEQTTASLVE
ncbi:unnamed protein product, partial [marine sediment metagenome]